MNNWNDKSPEFVQRWISQHIDDAQVQRILRTSRVLLYGWRYAAACPAENPGSVASTKYILLLLRHPL